MTPERWQQIDGLLGKARRRPVEKRAAFLARACDDAGVREEVLSLLACENSSDLIDKPIFSVHAKDLEIGRRIGAYKILSLLGRGGMGAVYQAVREDDYNRQVALKLIKRGMDSDEMIRRFQDERQILADLDHPNIARLLDGGTTEDGRPYLVMEHIEGEPIDRYCDRRKLSIEQRLTLFQQVCSAVHLSHQNLVIHRDLKPGNILVTSEGGIPKLLDFGIAKLLAPEITFERQATLPGQRPLTLIYASPEQLRGRWVTTASDTYSLGVLLYLLLTGHHPNALEEQASLSEEEILRRVLEQEPVKPSVAIRRERQIEDGRGKSRSITAESVSRNRGGDSGYLRKRLVGDLDAIVLKALRKEPRLRYGSVLELSDDLGRHQTGLPVTARKGTLPYIAGKFMRRNRVAVAILLLIAAFGVTTTVLWQQAEKQRRQADLISDFLIDLFKYSDPDQAQGEELMAREILARGKEQYMEALEGDPALRSEMADVLGQLFRNLGLYGDAYEVMGVALRELRLRAPDDSSELAKRINNLGAISFDLGNLDDAERYFRQAWEMRQRLGQKDSVTVKNMNNLASVLAHRGNLEAAEELLRQGLEIRRRLDGPHHENVATSLRLLANPLFLQGEFAQAEQLLRRSLAIRRRVYGSEHTKVAAVLDSLASVLLAESLDEEAEALYLEALSIRRTRLGQNHDLVTNTQRNLASLLLSRQDLSSAELDTVGVLLQQSLQAPLRKKAIGSRDLARTESLLGAYWVRLGRFAQAESCLVESYESLRQSETTRTIYTRRALDRVVNLYEEWQKEEKEIHYRKLIEPADESAGPQSIDPVVGSPVDG